MAVDGDTTVLMVMVDALRHDYLDPCDAPFLHALATEGSYGTLVPSFGFEPDGAYFAGLAPEECDGGAQYWLNPAERTFYATGVFGLLDRLPSAFWRRGVRQAARVLAQTLAPRRHSAVRRLASTAEIPYTLLGRFSFSLKRFAYETDYARSGTIFDALRAANRRYFFHGFPEHSVRVEHVEARYLAEERGGNDLTFLFIGDLDRVGHHFGPDSPERRAMLKRIDDALARIFAKASKYYSTVHLLTFGDHGMAHVERYLDLRGAIERAGLDPVEDSYFLDSTLARFWVTDERRRRRLVNVLNDEGGGRVLSEEDRVSYRIRWPHRHFGDVIFAAEPRVLLHPSFYCWSGQPPEGMHGYLPECSDNHSAIVLHGPRVSGLGDLGRVDMRRVFPTILDLLGLHDPVASRREELSGLIPSVPPKGRGA